MAPAPPTMANPGAVAIANKDEPIANNQHWVRSISEFMVSVTRESYKMQRRRRPVRVLRGTAQLPTAQNISLRSRLRKGAAP
ncbi:hypothetical protein MPRG_28940 [Mycobacterium paragordonae]|uniref:Uncharacterized protein n=1 Tax=Mycobacterium paragordonae TaxID=1389713 RepID=A0ABQ1C5A4_9MYCO|nr:hypothetical protein MPRG_28940 [Mycobacterium paragordonae]